MYQFPVIGRDTSYFVKSLSKFYNEYKQDEIIQMWGQHMSPVWRFNRQLVCQWYKLCPTTRWFVFTRLWCRFVEELLKNKENYPKHLISSFPCIDDVLSLTDSWFCDYLHLIYPNELEIKDATDTQMSASYLDIHLEIGNGGILEI